MKKKYPESPSDWRNFKVTDLPGELNIGGWQVMQDWEKPLMNLMAAAITWNQGDILEVGYGMGISAKRIARSLPRSHTIIEAHPIIAQRAREWAREQTYKVRIIEGFWQDVVLSLRTKFDGILFDTFPMNAEEKYSNHFPFIPHAPAILKRKGRLTFFPDETVPFRQDHLTLLLNHFSEVHLHRLDGLKPPKGCEYWEHNSMVVPICIKG